jgi:hypothetical protein
MRRGKTHTSNYPYDQRILTNSMTTQMPQIRKQLPIGMTLAKIEEAI